MGEQPSDTRKSFSSPSSTIRAFRQMRDYFERTVAGLQKEEKGGRVGLEGDRGRNHLQTTAHKNVQIQESSAAEEGGTLSPDPWIVERIVRKKKARHGGKNQGEFLCAQRGTKEGSKSRRER